MIAIGLTLVGGSQLRLKLDGTWVVTSLNVNGRVIPGTGQSIFRFAGYTYEHVIDGTIRERGIIDVDEAKQPMTIDFIIEAGAPPNTIQRDLIESEGDTLRLHVELGSGVRPRLHPR